jgi:hypothetical protein
MNVFKTLARNIYANFTKVAVKSALLLLLLLLLLRLAKHLRPGLPDGLFSNQKSQFG